MVFITRQYKKARLSVDDFHFVIDRFILININGNKSKKSWKLIYRTKIFLACCARLVHLAKISKKKLINGDAALVK